MNDFSYRLARCGTPTPKESNVWSSLRLDLLEERVKRLCAITLQKGKVWWDSTVFNDAEEIGNQIESQKRFSASIQ